MMMDIREHAKVERAKALSRMTDVEGRLLDVQKTICEKPGSWLGYDWGVVNARINEVNALRLEREGHRATAQAWTQVLQLTPQRREPEEAHILVNQKLMATLEQAGSFSALEHQAFGIAKVMGAKHDSPPCSPGVHSQWRMEDGGTIQLVVHWPATGGGA